MKSTGASASPSIPMTGADAEELCATPIWRNKAKAEAATLIACLRPTCGRARAALANLEADLR